MFDNDIPSSEVKFHLSLSLLKGDNWHYNAYRDHGIIGPFTKFPYQILGDPESFQPDSLDEFVFHDSIPLSLVDRITVGDKPYCYDNYIKVLEACSKYSRRIEVISINSPPYIPYRNLIGLYSHVPMYIDNPPYYGYYEGMDLLVDNYNCSLGGEVDVNLLNQAKARNMKLCGISEYETIPDSELVLLVRKQLIEHVMNKPLIKV